MKKRIILFIVGQFFVGFCSDQEIEGRKKLDQQLRNQVTSNAPIDDIHTTIAAKANINRYTDTEPNALCAAVEQENLPVISLLLWCKGDPTAPGNKDKQRPLHITINPEILKLLAAWYPPQIYEEPWRRYQAAEIQYFFGPNHNQRMSDIRKNLNAGLITYIPAPVLTSIIIDHTYGSKNNPLEFIREWNMAHAERYLPGGGFRKMLPTPTEKNKT